MTTMNSFKVMQQSFVINDIDNENQSSNFNLNRSNKCPILIPVQSFSKSNNNNDYDSTVSDKSERKLQTWKKSSIFSNLTTSKDESGETKKRWKKEIDSTNKSTLSLHISAYENSNEIVTEVEAFKKPSKTFLIDSTFIIQNPFEFPRQQQNADEVSEPEIFHYQASQRLINPNEALTNDQQNSQQPLTPYDHVLQNPPETFQPPTSITVQPWKSAFFEKFGGDIKIVEKKVDMNAAVEEDNLPEYLKSRYISIFVKDYIPSENEWSDLNVIIENDDNVTEFRTQKMLFPDMWAQVENVIERLTKSEVHLFEIRSTFYCYQSNLESLILKQVLCQELSDIPDVLITTDPKYCKARFFKRAMEPNLKKFSKRVRSTFELTELASKVHAVGLKYNPGPFPDFEWHEIIPKGFKFGKEEE